jgi:hypothetical protein
MTFKNGSRAQGHPVYMERQKRRCCNPSSAFERNQRKTWPDQEMERKVWKKGEGGERR